MCWMYFLVVLLPIVAGGCSWKCMKPSAIDTVRSGLRKGSTWTPSRERRELGSGRVIRCMELLSRARKGLGEAQGREIKLSQLFLRGGSQPRHRTGVTVPGPSETEPAGRFFLSDSIIKMASWTEVPVPDEALLGKIRAGLSKIKMPGFNERVRKVECVYSFDTPESPEGLFVSMSNFQGLSAHYIDMEFAREKRWKKIPKPEKPAAEKEEITKLAIGVEGGFDIGEEKFEYDKKSFLALMPDKILVPLPQQELPELISMVVDGIMKASDLSEDEAQVMAWEDKRQISKYADSLIQVDNGKKINPDPSTWACEESGIKEGLWLNLSDGHIGSGRAQVGADGQMGGGTGAALKHFQAEKARGNHYPLAVKLGTITPKGADVYSYAPDEDDMVEDPKLAQHLAHWGINMMQMEKTEKTMAELQIDMNMKFDFDKICESGKALQLRSGPGYVGLKNMGNSCYMNSVVQVLCSLPEVKARYVSNAAATFQATPASRSAEDFMCQMSKLSVGLLTEKYSKPEESASLAPQMFKFLVGKGHAEFSTGNQQDAQEYLGHLLDKIDRAEHANNDGNLPTSKLFEFTYEERVQCTQSNKVRYTEQKERLLSVNIPLEAAVNAAEVMSYEERAGKRQKSGGSEEKETPIKPQIPFEACLEMYCRQHVVTDYKSPATGAKGTALKHTKLKTFPKYLFIHLKKYVMGDDWRPKKLDVCVKAPETLDLDFLRSAGPQAGEEMLPEDAAAPDAAPAAGPVPDESIVAQCVTMGFSENGCKRAALATNNTSADAAAEWIFAHMDDSNFNDPIEQSGTGAGPAQLPPESVEMLMGMGFQKKHAEKALKECGSDIERAADWLFSRMDSLDAMDVDEPAVPHAVSALPDLGTPNYNPQYKLKGFISHVGSSTACGHYVCHIKKDDKWTIFNDRKVAVSEEPPFDLGYIYLYESIAPA